MNPNRLLTLALLVASLAGCQAGPGSAAPGIASTANPSAGPTARASAPPAPTRTPSPTVALGPAVSLSLDGGGPMVRSTDGPAGRQYALPAAAARDAAGGYVLFIVWFGPDAGDQVVTLARSDDARTWRIGRKALFTDLGMDLANPGPIPSAAVQLDDGTWLLYGWAAHAANPNNFSSWRASAPEPEGPWTLDGEQVLTPGGAPAWDSQSASISGVHRTAEGFALWYEGQAPGASIRGDVGFATSADGLTWAKANDPSTDDPSHRDSDPVIRRGICGPGSSQAVFQPQVEETPGGYLAVLGAFAPGRELMDLFGATSIDGRNWLCSSETPLLRAEDIPGSEGIHTIASMPLGEDRIGLLIESLGDARSDIWLATVAVAQ